MKCPMCKLGGVTIEKRVFNGHTYITTMQSTAPTHWHQMDILFTTTHCPSCQVFTRLRHDIAAGLGNIVWGSYALVQQSNNLFDYAKMMRPRGRKERKLVNIRKQELKHAHQRDVRVILRSFFPDDVINQCILPLL